MKKKIMAPLMCLVLLAGLLAGCSGPQVTPPQSTAPTPPPPASTPAADPTPPAGGGNMIDVTVSNGSSFIFNELYVTPTASDYWGDDHLGSTSILKSGGSYDVTLQQYEFNNYDVRVVDEDRYVYLFSRVTLYDGSLLEIGFSDGLTALVSHPDGTSETYYGEVDGANATDDVGGGGGAATPAPTGTGNDTNGAYDFIVYNESAFDIYAIYMGILNSGSSNDIDILPQILSANSSTTVSGIASQGDWLNTEWTLYVKDMDGDTSKSYDTFNPWTLSYVDIYWEDGGYVCDFHYN